jgi:hypothetical protein
VQIREEQWSRFQAHAAASFEERMIHHIGTAYPEENAALMARGGLAAVRKLVQDTIVRARSYNITMESPVAGLIDLTMVYGQNFELTDKMSWTKKILTDNNLAGSSKIAMIFELLPGD